MVYICMAILVCYSHEDECGIVLVGHEKRAPPCLVFSIQLGRETPKNASTLLGPPVHEYLRSPIQVSKAFRFTTNLA